MPFSSLSDLNTQKREKEQREGESDRQGGEQKKSALIGTLRKTSDEY